MDKIGNVIKFLLEYLGIQYNEKVYNVTKVEEWFDEKWKLGLDFPNLPYYVDGNLKLTESKAIAKYLVRHKDPQARLYPKTLERQIKADMIENVLFSVLYGLLLTCWRDAEELREWHLQNHANSIKQLSAFFGDNEWLLGDELSYVDFWLYEALYVQRQYNPAVLDSYDNLKAFMTNFEAIPAIEKYMESSKYVKTPCNSPNAYRPIA